MDIKTLPLLSISEAAKLVGVNRQRFYVLVKQYQIPHQNLSCGMIFLRQDIEDFQEKRKEKLKHRQKK